LELKGSGTEEAPIKINRYEKVKIRNASKREVAYAAFAQR
jgi:hypothetical protein